MEREVRYCTTEDGVRIAYSIEGSGPPVLLSPMILESFLLEHMSPEYRRFSQRLAERCQVIQYSPRGTGSSERGVPDCTLDGLVRDVEAVIRATGLDRVSLCGRATLGPAIISFTARHGEMVDRLVLYSTAARMPDVMGADEARGFEQLCRANWNMAARTLADISSRAEFGDRALQNAEWYRQSSTGEDAARLLESVMKFDVTSLLDGIRCPTLVLQPMDDARWKPEFGQALAAAIPNATLVPVQGGLHSFALGDQDLVLRPMLEFMGCETKTGSRDEQSPFRTVLFTDIVGHTEMMSRLGDEKGREVLREHERITRKVLDEHGGTELKSMGDGFMASFSSVTKAVTCAIEFQRAFEDWNRTTGIKHAANLKVRVGLNAGEPVEEEGDLFGASVILAARIAAKADGGEILSSDVIRGLCSGKGFLFSDRGEFAAKGFEEPVRLFEISWRE